MSALVEDPAPCRCLHSHAAVTPMHSGHCCFWPESQTCHLDEVADWQADHDALFPAPSPEPRVFVQQPAQDRARPMVTLRPVEAFL